jgi:hypothetical protein
MATAMTDGSEKALSMSPLCSAISLILSTIITTETVIISAQKHRFPAVSIRALPDGNFLPSTFATARWHMINVRLDKGSKRESAMVVNIDNDFEDTAA